MEDIVRLENINNRRFSRDIKITKGFAIILTNNNTYRNSSFENTALEEYSLMDKRSVGPGTLEINDSYKHPSLEPLSLSGHYTFEWNDYKLESDAMLNDKTPGFSFLVVEVDPKKD